VSDTIPDVVREKLKALKIRYIESLPERLESLASGLHALYASDAYDEDVFYGARNTSHKLAGSGQTFGFFGISDTARQIELQIERWMKETHIPTAEEREGVDHLFHELTRFSKEARGVTTAVLGRGGDNSMRVEVPFANSFTGEKKRICIWKSDASYLEDIQEQLGFFGFPTEMVKATDELRSYLEAGQTLVIMADIETVKEGSTYSAAFVALKKGAYKEQIKILYLSEQNDFETRLLAVRNSGDSFMPAPFDIPRLIEKLDSLFDGTDQKPYHVLIIDDDPEQISYYAMILQQAGMVTSVVTDPSNVTRVLIEEKPELILMDVYMEGCKGEELTALIRQQEAFVGIPIVYFSVEKNLEKQMAALQEGGDDFLTKPIKPEYLVTAVKTRASRVRQMRYFMERDSLTGLLNHTQLHSRLISEIDRARRIGGPLTYTMIDLDHFKLVNDEFGHMIGDHVLKTLSRLLIERLRKTDVLGRYGGEEFGIVLFNTNLENTLRVMNEIRESFSRIRYQGRGKDFFVTFSCGVADFPRFSTAELLMEAADKALYEAKHQGRNQVVPAP